MAVIGCSVWFVGRSACTSTTEAVCLFVRHVASAFSVFGARGHTFRLHRGFDEGVQS